MGIGIGLNPNTMINRYFIFFIYNKILIILNKLYKNEN